MSGSKLDPSCHHNSLAACCTNKGLMAHVNIKETYGSNLSTPGRPPVTGIPFRALFDYSAGSEDEVSLREGDVVEAFDRSGLWWTVLIDGNEGLAPHNFLEPISGSVDVVSAEDNAISMESAPNTPNETIFPPISPRANPNLTIPTSPLSPSSKPTLPKLVLPNDTPKPDTLTPISAASSHTSGGFSNLGDQSSSPGVSPAVGTGVRVLPTRVRALFDVTGTEEGELSFKKGDIIEVDLRSSAEVWRGKVNGSSGVFRLNFSVEPILKERVRALWDFVGTAQEDLSFKAGDIIQVYGPSSSSTWWWHGFIQGKGIGTFPYNFVEPLEDEFADSESEGDDPVRPSIIKSLARFRVLKDVVAIEEGMLSLKQGDILELVSKQSHEKWLGRSRYQTGTFFLDENIEPIMTNKVKALYDFVPSNSEELAFKSNDIITVVGPSDESNTFWWYGTVQGKLGMFPYNFVELIPDERGPDSDEDDWVDVTSSNSPIVPGPHSTSPKPAESAGHQRTPSNPKASTSKEHYRESGIARPHDSIWSRNETIPAPKILAKALQGHSTDHPQSLTFKKGDIIEVLEMPGSSRWWKGALDGKTGYFPFNLVELSDKNPNARPSLDSPPAYVSGVSHPPAGKHSRTATNSVLLKPSSASNRPSPLSTAPNPSISMTSLPPSTPRFARALYDFKAEHDGDLIFLSGDIVELIEMPNNDWWTGRLRDKTGLVPANYLHIIDSETASRTIYTDNDKERSDFVGNKQSRIPSTSKAPDDPKILQRQPPVEWVRARHRYESKNRRELGFERGDLIQVTHKRLEHWWKGKMQKDGLTSEGLFPLNYVEIVPQPVPLSPQDQPHTSSPVSLLGPRRRSSLRLEDDEAVLMLRSNVAKLFPLLKDFNIERDLAEDVEIQDLFRNACILRRRVVRLLKDEPFSDELIQIDATFKEVKDYYDLVMQLCANRHLRQGTERLSWASPLQQRPTVSTIPSSSTFLTGSGSSGYTLVSEPTSYATGTTSIPPVPELSINSLKRQSTEGSIRMDLPRAPHGDKNTLKPSRLSQTMSVTDPTWSHTSSSTRLQYSSPTAERRFDGRLSAIEADIARACEDYQVRHSRDRTQMPVEENTRKLPSSPAVKILTRVRRRKEATKVVSIAPEPAHNKTIYKKEVEYQYMHIVHENQAPRPSKKSHRTGGKYS
ncbi:Intersectin 1 (SH3 domain protein) [Serendipita sp. 407]|nr:Intersectin 1 (SH3 domain protein) [Serendipita sp. 407]